MKLKSFSELDAAYAAVRTDSQDGKYDVINEKTSQDVAQTDISMYLPENAQVKTGSALGGGPGTKDDTSPLAKKTGPSGLKGNNFAKIDKQQDPGADAKVMKKEEDNEEAEVGNVQQADTAKVTTPKEKVMESGKGARKYNYNPKFTMSKPKFDQLYEEAIKRVPFTEGPEDNFGGAEDMGVPPADDATADADISVDGAVDGTEEEVALTHEEAVECCEKLLKFLKKDLASDDAQGTTDMEDLGSEGEDNADDVVAEKIVSEPEPKEEKGNNASLQGKNNKVGDIKKSGGTADKGAAKSDPSPKEFKGNDASLQGKNNKVGNLSTGKKLFD